MVRQLADPDPVDIATVNKIVAIIILQTGQEIKIKCDIVDATWGTFQDNILDAPEGSVIEYEITWKKEGDKKDIQIIDGGLYIKGETLRPSRNL